MGQPVALTNGNLPPVGAIAQTCSITYFIWWFIKWSSKCSNPGGVEGRGGAARGAGGRRGQAAAPPHGVQGALPQPNAHVSLPRASAAACVAARWRVLGAVAAPRFCFCCLQPASESTNDCMWQPHMTHADACLLVSHSALCLVVGSCMHVPGTNVLLTPYALLPSFGVVLIRARMRSRCLYL